jgi:iron complex outermembrane receptor protein
MNKLKIIIISSLLLFPMLMAAQINVKGTVTDSKTGEPLVGVSIAIVNTQKGTTTDFDGHYILNNVMKNSLLEFSSIGYVSKRIIVKSNIINVKLQESTEKLDEVIVVGYGTAKKEDLTGSVNKLTAKNFNKGAVSSAQNLITGKIAGVTVVAPSGAPGEGGSINIRGLSSLSLTNNPLFVVDGIPLGGGVSGSRNMLDFVNPNDIKSIVVLKDASATAIYGSRAANGVVMISTKKGKKKDFSFNFGNKTIIATPFQQVDVMSAQEFTQVVTETGDANAINRLGNSHTNWQDEIYHVAIGTQYDFTASGSALNAPLRLSIAYLDQEGILKKDNYERTTASINYRPSFLNDYLKLEINARGMYTENTFGNRGAIGSAISFDPTQSVYDANSPFAGYFSWIDPASTPPVQYALAPTNPVALINLTNDFSFVKRFAGNAKINYKLHFFPDVVATVNLGLDQSQGNGHSIVSADIPTSNPNWLGTNNTYTNKVKNQLLDTYLTYSKELKKHSLKFMTGYSYQMFDYDNTYYDDYAFQQGATDHTKIDLSKEVLLSYFGRLNYKFNNKYLVTASLRADASSLLNPADRWGYFPSVALAWNIHKESFMKNNKLFDELKLRVGYGAVGNVNGLSPYKYLTRYQKSTTTAGYQFGSNFYQTYRPEPINKQLKWEIGKTTNIGLDYSMFKHRLFGSINLYNKETQDLIIWSLVDPFTNFGNRVETNVGNMTNKGIELEINGVVIKNKDFTWNVNYNIAYNDNKITYMPFEQSVGGIEGGVGNTVQSHTEGQSPYSFLVYEQVYDSNGKPLEGVYVDRNKDGIINNKDLYFYKDPLADIQMGLSTSVKYGNFDLSITSRASLGNYMYDNVASSKSIPADITTQPFLTNLHSDYLNSNFQTHSETNLLSDYYVKDASFVKIDNISMGYYIPKIYKNVNMRMFAMLQNVATFTDYTGLDPEMAGGIDNNFYPRPRTVTFGFNLDF